MQNQSTLPQPVLSLSPAFLRILQNLLIRQKFSDLLEGWALSKTSKNQYLCTAGSAV